MPQNGLKMGSFHPLVHPKWCGMSFGKMRFFIHPFSTHFWSQNSASSRHFGIFGGPKWATTSSKQSKNTCFSITHGLGSFLRKVIFLPHWTILTHLGTHLFGLELAACRSLVGLGTGVLGVHLGNFEAWKPQKVGGCGWTRCPRNRVFSHVAKDMACSWFVAVARQSAQNLGLLGAFLGSFRDIWWS